ncbi:N-acetylmuramoyl-L-alanine amidase [Thiohalobacter sp. IOR34]|uniref:N-acetylmuramoyl-L-alanine amidase n=1 Tax=Thiohalobacter sp. IOR34 TaxID=3057176 RepID=UPI0025AED01B|nr:N-acetylmuramoyl-L-alanine amidase [Thiohalobacter sp. IOR34]WJW74824.1 N-acetylmuramoyl-L-alanine amidase [Thiohalobacter sp. IOR34]
MLRALAAILMLLLAAVSGADTVELQEVRLWASPQSTRIVLDLSGKAEHSLFTLADPQRVVIDLRDTRFRASLRKLDFGQGLVRNLRKGVRNQHDLRLVLDLKGPAKLKSFLLPPDSQAGHRLVIDLLPPAAAAAASPQPVKRADRLPARPRDLVIAIDAGHGGKDPGAHGRRGTREKDVVLAIARRLARLIDREPGMRALLVRDDDRFLRLRERIRKARKHRADLFVSIHADAFNDRRVHGSSVFVLSRRGASSEMARLLAKHENDSDLVGGVSLNDKDDLLKTVLLDLSQAASIEASAEVASQVLAELKRIGKVHKAHVQKAGFVVLKSPDIPSILVETAFISNPAEERKLRDGRHQQRLAEAMLRGIRAYFRNNPPPGTLLAMRSQPRQHVIRSGDTLSEIARRYDVSLRELKVANRLTGDRLRIGDVLQIPQRGS